MAVQVLNIPQVQRPYLRVGFITPSLNMGGAERWFLTLAKHFQSVKASCIGFIGDICSEFIADEASRITKLYTANHIGYGESLGGAASVIDRVFYESDIVCTWGIDRTAELYAPYFKPVVDVSHNERDFPDQAELCGKSWQGAHFLAGVSVSSIKAFPADVAHMATAIYNGAEADRVAPRRERKAMRFDYGFTEEDRVVVFMGRFAKQKHPEKIVQALHLLPENYKAIFVGRGRMEADIQEHAAELVQNPESPRVKFFPSTAHVGDYFEMADVFALPSEYEGHPIATCEAWMAGIPTVLTDLSYVQELEELYKVPLCHKIPRKCTIQQLADAIKLAADNGRNHEIVRVARNIAWRSLSAPAMAYRWESYLIDCSRMWQNYMTLLPARTAGVEPVPMKLINGG